MIALIDEFYGSTRRPPVATDDVLSIKPGVDQTVKVKVNKETHEVKYDAETEQEVTVTIKPKG